jgi:arylformamidase
MYSLSPRNYTLEELDIQYNARATVEDATVYMRKYCELTESAKRIVPNLSGISYGREPEENLDIYCTPRPGAPVFVFIHGGYWRALSKDDSGFMAPAFTKAGATVVALNYALAPDVSLDTIVRQVRQAIVWIYRNIREYGGDPEKIHVCGSSAGGHLVGMLLQDGWHEAYGAPLDVVKSAVPISGLFDLRPLVHTHINAWLKHDLDDATRNSPMLRLADVDCPVLVAFAERDTDEFRCQSALYAEKWREKGNRVSVMDVANTNHFDVLFELMESDSQLFGAIAGLMRL